MNIDLPRMLLALREKLAYGDAAWQVEPASRSEGLAYRGWSWFIRSRAPLRTWPQIGRRRAEAAAAEEGHAPPASAALPGLDPKPRPAPTGEGDVHGAVAKKESNE